MEEIDRTVVGMRLVILGLALGGLWFFLKNQQANQEIKAIQLRYDQNMELIDSITTNWEASNKKMNLAIDSLQYKLDSTIILKAKLKDIYNYEKIKTTNIPSNSLQSAFDSIY